MTPQLLWQLLKQTGQAWQDNKAARLGAALAFYSVLSLSPLLVLLLAAASLVWGTEAAQGRIVGQMNDLVGQQGAEAIQNILAAGAANKYSGVVAALIGFGSLLFSASAVFSELQDALDIIWHAAPPKGKSWRVLIKEKVFSFSLVLGSGFLLLASALISACLAAITHYIDDMVPMAIFIIHTVNLIISFGIVAFLFALIFKAIPHMSIHWRSVWPGAILTAALFIIGKALIGLYIGHAGVASSYGAAGSIIILLVWIYYSAQILFFGAEFTYIYSCHFKLHQETQISPITARPDDLSKSPTSLGP